MYRSLETLLKPYERLSLIFNFRMWLLMVSVLLCGQNIDMVQGRPWLLPTPGENKEGNCNGKKPNDFFF